MDYYYIENLLITKQHNYMGTLNVKPISSQQELNEVTRDLLGDIRALEDMLAMGWFNEDPLHIGAEQEFCLVDPAMKASPKGFYLLDQLQQTEHDFTTEIAKFNVECNVPPIP
ncbi:MAG: hypothetical protein GVX78_03670, partial [Bacteroidetes bacterium]|nr:hypothetical protein [Bacteroidota bacterium]